MDSRDLTDEQRAKLIRELEGHRAFFCRLYARMKARGWYLDSPAFNAVEAAWNATSAAINGLRVEQQVKPRADLKDKPFELPPTETAPPPADAYRDRRRR
jgi:ribonuclease HII